MALSSPLQKKYLDDVKKRERYKSLAERLSTIKDSLVSSMTHRSEEVPIAPEEVAALISAHNAQLTSLLKNSAYS